MSNFTENENWINKLIDDYADAKTEMIEAAVTSNQLYTLKEIIFNNATLDYSGKELRISNDSVILEYLRAIYPDSYDIALTRLKDAQKAEIEKEKRKRGGDIARLESCIEEGSNNV